MTGTKERVGFLLPPKGKVVEVENICSDPENGFEVSAEDLVKYGETALASWHTHPGASSNLSADDFVAFLNYPNMKHYVVGMDGVKCYVVENGKVIHAP